MLNRKIESGLYPSASDAIAMALLVLDDWEEGEAANCDVESLRQAIQEGLKGPFLPGDEVLARLRERSAEARRIDVEIHLPPEVEEIVNRQIHSGAYHSPSEVIVQALWLMDRWQDTKEEKLDQLRQAIQEGIDSGRSSLSVGELFNELLGATEVADKSKDDLLT